MVDSLGQAYVCGSTSSDSFPTTPSALSSMLQGVNDMFLTKLSANGSALLYSTFLGGSGTEAARVRPLFVLFFFFSLTV